MSIKKRICLIILALLLIVSFIIGIIKYNSTLTVYIKSDTSKAIVYDHNYKEVSSLIRGSQVKLYKSNNKFLKIRVKNKIYYIKPTNITYNKSDVISEKEKYVRTPVILYKDKETLDILSMIKKGEKLEVKGFDYLVKGEVNKYKVQYQTIEGYVYSKYLVNSKEESIKNYDEENTYQVHKERVDTLGGGSAANLDFYPYPKVSFKNNKMPDEVKALYLNAGVLNNVDNYINIAKEATINAFVVDIKDNTVPGYKSKVMEKYSITNYNKAINSFEDYQKVIKKLKDNGFYVIGRITTFKDSYYANDHPDEAILGSDGKPFNHDGSYWPTAYNRNVWTYNVALGVEAVKEMGFNEIQFDYVRFPDRTRKLELSNQINFQNKYNEEKSQAIQQFLMYATDEIHRVGAYVSADVFGEAAHNYVTAYGQYWTAISNVVDVISPMPYPDHYNKYEYSFSEPVWTVPYKLLDYWGSTYVAKQQEISSSPAKVRSWIQTYDTSREPATKYDSNKISEEISALYKNGLDSGYMTWNGSSNIEKYNDVKEAFKKEYKNEKNN